MNPLKITTATVLISALFYSSAMFAESTIHGDSEIASHIQTKISEDKLVSNLNVHISSHGGVVTLSGKVNTDTEANKLIEIAESEKGVKDIDTSHLTVKESQHVLSDSAITAKVKGTFVREKLFGNKDINVMNVNVETTNGVVYLTGKVNTQEEADNAIKLAESIKGVSKVESKLEVIPMS